jgi:hypothetical protein
VTNTLFEAFSLYLKFLFFSLMFFFWVTKGKKERKKKNNQKLMANKDYTQSIARRMWTNRGSLAKRGG